MRLGAWAPSLLRHPVSGHLLARACYCRLRLARRVNATKKRAEMLRAHPDEDKRIITALVF